MKDVSETQNTKTTLAICESHSTTYLKWPDMLGRMIIKLVCWGLVVLVTVQILHFFGPVRVMISPVDRMEGVRVDVDNVKDWLDGKHPSLLHQNG